MDVAQRLTEPGRSASDPMRASCPRCGEGAGALAPVSCPTLDRVNVARCTRCGTRRTLDGRQPRLVFTCATCGVPFLADEILAHDEHRCESCRGGELPPEIPDEEVAAATECEIRLALDGRWRFVTMPTVQSYLDRIARCVATRIEGAGERARVALFQDPFHRALALPSGTLLVSTGLLAFLEDEAELAFVLGHEIAHASSGDAAVRLSRLGFEATARRDDGDADEAWAEAAADLVRLGYGRRRERDADARSTEALTALEYDTESIGRYLRRCGAAVDAGDPALSEFALAHPPAADRVRRIERALYGRVGRDVTSKVNREVFRRAVRGGALTTGLTPVRLGVLTSPAAGRGGGRWRRIALWGGLLALGIAASAGLVYLLR